VRTGIGQASGGAGCIGGKNRSYTISGEVGEGVGVQEEGGMDAEFVLVWVEGLVLLDTSSTRLDSPRQHQ